VDAAAQVPGPAAGSASTIVTTNSNASTAGTMRHGLELGELAAEHGGDHPELLVDVVGIRLGEDGADRGGDHLGRAFGDLGEQVAQEVDSTPLGRSAGHGGLDGLAQAKVRVGDHQLHAR
jgi:hypothetical protein